MLWIYGVAAGVGISLLIGAYYLGRSHERQHVENEFLRAAQETRERIDGALDGLGDSDGIDERLRNLAR